MARPSWKDLTPDEEKASAPDLLSGTDAILDQIINNAQEAVALEAINRPAAYDAETIARFDNTYAAHVFGLIRDKITLSLVLSLARCWDTGWDTQAIPRVTRLLFREDVVREIIDMRRRDRMAITEHPELAHQAQHDSVMAEWLRKTAEADAERAEKETRANAGSLTARVEELLASGLLKIAYRTKVAFNCSQSKDHESRTTSHERRCTHRPVENR
jgi:hypothetical protein